MRTGYRWRWLIMTLPALPEERPRENPQCGLLVAFVARRRDFAGCAAAEVGPGVEALGGKARGPPAVGVHPVREWIVGDERSVARRVEAAGGFGGEAVLLGGCARGEAPPVQGADQRGELDRFGVGRCEYPADAERLIFDLGWNQQVEPLLPVVPGAGLVLGGAGPRGVRRSGTR